MTVKSNRKSDQTRKPPVLSEKLDSSEKLDMNFFGSRVQRALSPELHIWHFYIKSPYRCSFLQHLQVELKVKLK